MTWACVASRPPATLLRLSAKSHFCVQVVLLEVGEQLDPHVGAHGRHAAHRDRGACAGGKLAVARFRNCAQPERSA